MKTGALNGTRILVLEDEFLIAMEVEQICRDHGAGKVSVVRDVAETEGPGFDLGEFDVAILDVMIGGRSSLPLAGRLCANRMPFIFTSGYIDMDEALSAFPGTPVVGKPYAESELVGAVVRALQPEHPR